MIARLTVVTALTAAVVACTGTADMTATSQQRMTQTIINGASCTEDTDPTAVAILFDGTIDLSQIGFGVQDVTTVMCTGTLIAPDTILTAAHCTDPSLLTGGFGEVTRADYYVSRQADLESLTTAPAEGEVVQLPESAIPVKSMIANEEFSIDNLNQNVNGPGEFHDVALMFLSTTIDDIEPELLITADEVGKIKEGASVEIAGWGQQKPTGQFEQPPPHSVGIKECGTSTINELGSAEMQIGADDTTVRKCHGDSGGPTYLDVGGDHEKTRRVIGVTSHAYDQEDCAKGGVDTRVDAHLDWIDDKMTAGCTGSNASRVWCDVDGIIPPDFFDPGHNGGDGDDDGDPKVAAKKGCASTDAASAVGALALGLIAVRRRRR